MANLATQFELVNLYFCLGQEPVKTQITIYNYIPGDLVQIDVSDDSPEKMPKESVKSDFPKIPPGVNVDEAYLNSTFHFLFEVCICISWYV